jgi:hypothetical protein
MGEDESILAFAIMPTMNALDIWVQRVQSQNLKFSTAAYASSGRGGERGQSGGAFAPRVSLIQNEPFRCDRLGSGGEFYGF